MGFIFNYVVVVTYRCSRVSRVCEVHECPLEERAANCCASCTPVVATQCLAHVRNDDVNGPFTSIQVCVDHYTATPRAFNELKLISILRPAVTDRALVVQSRVTASYLSFVIVC